MGKAKSPAADCESANGAGDVEPAVSGSQPKATTQPESAATQLPRFDHDEVEAAPQRYAKLLAMLRGRDRAAFRGRSDEDPVIVVYIDGGQR